MSFQVAREWCSVVFVHAHPDAFRELLEVYRAAFHLQGVFHCFGISILRHDANDLALCVLHQSFVLIESIQQTNAHAEVQSQKPMLHHQ